MTDYRKLKEAAQQRITNQTKARQARARQRRRPRPLPQPVFGDQPYGSRQCAACARWLPALHFWRRRHKAFAKRCVACIKAGRSAP